jgi:hypothetical protein
MTRHNTEYLTSIAPDIKKAAERLARQFTSIEYDDIYQNLWEWALNESYELIPSAEGGAAVKFLTQAGQRQCGKELAQNNPRADDFYYSPMIVRRMLDAGMLFYEDKNVTGRSDLLEAYNQLSDKYQEMVKRAFLENDEEYRKSGTASARLSEVMSRLAMEMNRIGESRSEWHQERAVSGWTGSKKLTKSRTEEY